jgi:hypothetical protein
MEAEWLTGTDPQKMLEFLRRKASNRKLRLFACACCRSIWHLLAETRGRDALEVGECYADGLVSERELAKARRKAQDAWTAINNAQPEAYERSRDAGEAGCILITAVDAAKSGTDKNAFTGAWSANICAAHAVGHQTATLGAPATYDDPDTYVREELAGRQKQYAHQCQLMRCVFGNPFRPLKPLAPSPLAWNSGLVVRLASAAYEERVMPGGHLDPGRLGVLADALEDGVIEPEGLDLLLSGLKQHAGQFCANPSLNYTSV